MYRAMKRSNKCDDKIDISLFLRNGTSDTEARDQKEKKRR